MENEQIITKEEFLECLHLCIEKCKANSVIKAQFEKAPTETFKEITGKVCPKEGFVLTEEEKIALNDLIRKEFPQGCCELREGQLTDVSGGQPVPCHWLFDLDKKMLF